MTTIAPGARTIVALAVAVYLVPLAWRVPLIDPDEGLHAAIAREMAERGDYLVPRFLGEPFLDKPILFFFAQAASLRGFGPSEAAVRAPGQLFGFLGAVTTGLIAAAFAGRRAGITAGCIHATLALPLALNQAPVHDVALVPWTNLALLCFVRAGGRERDARHVLRWCSAAGLPLGLAVLTKGLSGVALVGLPVAAWLVVRRALTRPLVAGGAASLLIALFIAMPWYLAVERTVPGYLHYFFVERHLLGFATTTQVHGWRPWWYYLPVVAAGSVPWIVTLPSAWRGTRDLPQDLRALRRFATIWLVANLVFLSAAGSKLATYVLPLFPAAACLVAVAWRRAPGIPEGDRAPIPGRGLSVHAAVGAAIVPTVLLAASGWLRVSVSPWAWGLALVLALAWFGIAMPKTCARRHAFTTSLLLIAAGLLVLYATALPAAANAMSARDLAAHVNARGALPTRLWIVDERVGSFVFYLDPRLREALRPAQLDGVPLFRALLQGGGVPGTVLAVPRDTLTKLAQRVRLDVVAFEPAGRYRLYDPDALRHAPVRTAPAKR